MTILIEFSFLIDFFSMKEFRGGIIRLFEQGKNANQQEKIWARKKCKAEETRNLVKDIFPECIDVDISPQRNNGEWPPNSPDLNVLDYSLWSILEAEACSKPHQSIEALKKSLVKAWNNIPQEVIDRAVDDFPKRLKKCVEAGGGHFENK